MVGKTLGKYKIVEKIGEGGFGIVWKAEHVTLGHPVAIKRLHPRWAYDEEFAKRFRREAKVMADLSPHPHIVQVMDIDTIDDVTYFVMEYLPRNLESYLKNNKTLPINNAVNIVLQVCRALEKTHGMGVYHRDIHPGNLFFIKNIIKVGDFGLAKITSASSLSYTGEKYGRIGYVAPEQIEDFKQADQRADIYSLGVVLYRMLVGNLPTIRREWAEPKKVNPSISEELNNAIIKAIADDVNHRYQTIDEFRSVIERSRYEDHNDEKSRGLQDSKRVEDKTIRVTKDEDNGETVRIQSKKKELNDQSVEQENGMRKDRVDEGYLFSREKISRRPRKGLYNIILIALIVVITVLMYSGLKKIFSNNQPQEVKRRLVVNGNAIAIEVLNGCGTADIGDKLADHLRKEGFDVVSIGNYESYEVLRTMIVDRIGNVEKCFLIARALGLDEIPILEDVNVTYAVDATIVIGKDYRKLSFWSEIEDVSDNN